MRVEYTLFEIPMTADPTSSLSHPPMRTTFQAPSQGHLVREWVKQRSTGSASLLILWAVTDNDPSLSLVPADLPITEDVGKVVEVAA